MLTYVARIMICFFVAVETTHHAIRQYGRQRFGVSGKTVLLIQVLENRTMPRKHSSKIFTFTILRLYKNKIYLYS